MQSLIYLRRGVAAACRGGVEDAQWCVCLRMDSFFLLEEILPGKRGSVAPTHGSREGSSACPPSPDHQEKCLPFLKCSEGGGRFLSVQGPACRQKAKVWPFFLLEAARVGSPYPMSGFYGDAKCFLLFVGPCPKVSRRCTPALKC